MGKDFFEERNRFHEKKNKKDNRYMQQFQIKPEIALVHLGRLCDENPPVEVSCMSVALRTNDTDLLVVKNFGEQAIVCENGRVYPLNGAFEVLIDKRISEEEKFLIFSMDGLQKILSCKDEYDKPSFMQLLVLTTNSFIVNCYNSDTTVRFVDYTFQDSEYINSSASLFYGLLSQMYPSASEYLLSIFRKEIK